MKLPARKIRYLGEATYREEADAQLKDPGDAVVIRRGVVRSLMLKRPDGCGETLAVNLDLRAGKAWHLDVRRGQLTLYPSVWREGGCKSHFILWRDLIIWAGPWERDNVEPSYDQQLEDAVGGILDDDFRSVPEIASLLEEIPWEVQRACRALVRKGRAESSGPHESYFRKKAQKGRALR